MHLLLTFANATLVAAMLFVLPASAQFTAMELESEAPDAAFFENEPGRTWFSHCEYQNERYVVCKNAAQPILDTILKPDTTPGAALQTHIREIFEKKGCTFAAPADTFRVNGIFLSLDMEGAKAIKCGEDDGKLVFKPGVIAFLDTLYFLNDGPPR